VTFPAAVGSPIAVYLMGLGAVNPAVATGAPAAGISGVTLPVTATIGGVNASVLFAGLAPGYIGLYQVSQSCRSSRMRITCIGVGSRRGIELRDREHSIERSRSQGGFSGNWFLQGTKFARLVTSPVVNGDVGQHSLHRAASDWKVRVRVIGVKRCRWQTSEFATPAFAAAEIRSNGLAVGSETRLGRDAPVRRVVVAVVERCLIGVHDRVDVHALGAELEAVHAHVNLW
jgi:hypothetical protein